MRRKLFILFLMVLAGCNRQNSATEPAKAYQPTLGSIRIHECPEWFKDAKFGMFVDWGLYSVAGWAPKKPVGEPMYPDWYLHNMYQLTEWRTYHQKTWGEQFQRDDFIPLFTAENYQPDRLIQLAADCGVKYVVPFCKHHDGFCLWPSSLTERDAADMGPKRDLVAPLVQQCREHGLKFGFYFSIEEWEYPVIRDGQLRVRLWQHGEMPIMDIPYVRHEMAGKITGKKPVEDFFGEYIIPQAKEFIDMYGPDILWFDGEWRTPVEDTRTPEIVSYFYNQAGKKVAVNDRLGRGLRFKVGDFFTSEYHSLDSEQPKIVHKWEECRGISQSFGYNRQDTEENVQSARDFIHMFVEIVSENGNLLLIVNLDGKGALPGIQENRLREIGAWLKVNGEAIYATKPWLVSHQDQHIRFTQSKNGKNVYAICTRWPEKTLAINSVYLEQNAQITMLGCSANIPWVHKDGHVHLTVPESVRNNKPCDHAWVFKLPLFSPLLKGYL